MLWDTFMSMPPADFKKQFTEALEASGEKTTIRMMAPNETTLVVTSLLGDAGNQGDAEGMVTRRFSFDDGVRMPPRVEHSVFFLGEGLQGKGIAKRVLKDHMQLYQRMGVSSVRVDAGDDVGGYAWAKFGFVPNQPSWNKLRDLVGKRLDRDEKVSPADKAIVRRLLTLDDPKTIWPLADYRNGIGRELLLGTSWTGHLRLSDEQAMRRFRAYTE